MGDLAPEFEFELAKSFIGWWRDAGVDCAISEHPGTWLSLDQPQKPDVAPVASNKSFPTLAVLVDHLLTADLPALGSVHGRVSPQGPCPADLMILADLPDAADVAASIPLSDPIVDRMLAAIDQTRAGVYIALVSPGRPPSGRIADENISELANLARRHIDLAAPKQLWLMGSAASRAILAIDEPRARGRLHEVNLNGTIITTIATPHPRMFANSKSAKAAAWAEMQRLIEKETA